MMRYVAPAICPSMARSMLCSLARRLGVIRLSGGGGWPLAAVQKRPTPSRRSGVSLSSRTMAASGGGGDGSTNKTSKASLERRMRALPSASIAGSSMLQISVSAVGTNAGEEIRRILKGSVAGVQGIADACAGTLGSRAKG